MNVDEVKEFFGTLNEAAKQLGITDQNFQLWRKRGIPRHQQIILERLSNGKLIADIDFISRLKIVRKKGIQISEEVHSNYLYYLTMDFIELIKEYKSQTEKIETGSSLLIKDLIICLEKFVLNKKKEIK